MATSLEIMYSGVACGAPVAISGRGDLDVGEQARTLKLSLDACLTPLHWDPLLAVISLVHATLTLPDEDPVALRSQCHLSDEDGRELGSWAESIVVSATPTREEWGGLTSAWSLVTGRGHSYRGATTSIVD